MWYNVLMTVMGWHWQEVEADNPDQAIEIARKNVKDQIDNGLEIRELDNIELDPEPEITN